MAPKNVVRKNLSKGHFFGTLKWFKTFKGKLDQLIIRDFKYQNRKYGIFIIFEQLIRENFQWPIIYGTKCFNVFSKIKLTFRNAGEF